ncbi:DUF3060 domain-containing protein [Glutamicibacter creatinolyticus]|uniref:DUF3060 domain-containing protein n=1 Tax=Glutamicibacter creatinolyticus TaxID=162496 RepID=UPI0037C12F41
MEKKTMHSAGLSLAVLLLASAGLSGCVSVQPENGTETSSGPITSPSAPEQDTQSPTAQPSPSSSAPAATSSSPAAKGAQEASFSEIFKSINSNAAKKLECLDENHGRNDADDLYIKDKNTVISITGDCDDVVISGDNLVIAATEIDDLIVRGNNNVIAVQDLDNVEVSGSGNHVGWDPAYEDDPDVENHGPKNVLRHDAVGSAELDL